MDTPSENRRSVYAELWSAAWRYPHRTSLALLLLLLAKVAGVGVPLLLKAVVDQFSRPESLAETVRGFDVGGTSLALVLPVFLLLAYALLRFMGTLFTELRDLVFAPVTRRTVTAFSQRTFSHLLSLNPQFHSQRNTGVLIRDVERGISGMGFLLGAGLFTVVPTLVEFAAVLAVMALGYSAWFTVVILLTFFVYAGVTTWLTQKRELRQRRVNEMDSRANGRLVEMLLNYDTVKAFAREPFERERYLAICEQWIASSIQNQRALSGLHIAQSAVIAAGVASVMLLAGQQTMRGVMTVGDLVLVNAYVIQICLPLNALGFVFREARDAIVNTEKLFDLLSQQPEIDDGSGSAPLQVHGGAVVFEHVSFAYEPGRRVIDDINLAIGAGQTVAVVGGSGSGKSTLARLLLRLYDVQAGRVTVDGQDVRSVRIDSLRDAIGIVPQDTVLFNDTVAYNIAYGRIGAGMADVIEAAKAAQVHEFIQSLPEQYETQVGERGTKLSGGEKQRIAIARAFLKNPPIMIFDEATSALDTRAERAIQVELDRISQGRTTLVIAHRLSTIVHADEIVVMDKGRVVERGRHEALLERDGLYAQLWNLQRQQQQFERVERQMARQPVQLAPLIAAVIDGMRPILEARHVGLFTDIDPSASGVTGDPNTLSQVLHALCTGALSATPRGGRIELRLERVTGWARIGVTDGRHTRASRDGALPAFPGAVPLDPLAVRSTLERQGGRFAVEPPTSVRGMRYTIELPLRAVAVAAEATAAVPADHPLEGLRIILIDDESDARESLTLLLEAEGAAVLSFGMGTEALAWLRSHGQNSWPQAIVCDVMLDHEDGHAIVRAVRQLEAERGVSLDARVPAIALTGLGSTDDRVRALMAGFQVHLAKPVDPHELVQTLYRLATRADSERVAATSTQPERSETPLSRCP